MAQRHSTPIRGLMATNHSPLFQGRFGRLFRSLPPAKFGATDADNLRNLAALGAKMSASFDPPTDGKDPEESGIPALYTYLGQFVDHDLDLTGSGDVAFDVPVPVGDPYFDPNSTGTEVIYFNRSLYDAASGTATPNVQQQTYTINYQPRHGGH